MNFDDLWKAIFAAMKEPLEAGWLQAKTLAEAESKKIAQSLITITTLFQLPDAHPEKITKTQAKLLVDIQVAASRALLLGVEALGLIAVQRALKSGLSAVKSAVNGQVGFALL